MEQNKKAENLARDILALSRNVLLVNFHYLTRAMSRLEFLCSEHVSAATDGTAFYYNPWYVLRLYQSEPSAVTHTLLHSVLHCIFHHNLVGRDIDRTRWDFAADAAVAYLIAQLEVTAVCSKLHNRQQSTLHLLQEEIGVLTAERIYCWLGEQKLRPEELSSQRDMFLLDSHGLWYDAPEAQTDQQLAGRKKVWEDIARRMQTELETLQQNANHTMVQTLRELNRVRYNYSEFLRRFAIHGEELRLSDEEFDQNYYSYGLSLYGDMPLVEPLEYGEYKRICQFVIAIDTSGSVRGDVVQSFIQHTHDMLCQRDRFSQRVEMHIIQCDDTVQEDVLIRSQEAFQDYLSRMEIKGLGKTDFRPVFTHVDELRRKGQLRNLQGLIYFTDGDGTFPAKKPDYDTAFILCDSGYREPDIPSWAMRLTLRKEDILDKRFSHV